MRLKNIPHFDNLCGVGLGQPETIISFKLSNEYCYLTRALKLKENPGSGLPVANIPFGLKQI